MEKKDIIKVPMIYKKFQMAEEMAVPIYISGAVGFGKTTAMEYFYRKQAHLVLSGELGYFPEMPEISTIKQRVIVFDDLSWLTDEVSKQYVTDIIEKRKANDKQIVLIGRSPLPSWLRVLSVAESFVTAGEQDLMFSDKEVKLYLERNEIFALPEEIYTIQQDSYGHPLSLNFLVYQIKNRMSENIEPKENQIGCGYGLSDMQQTQLDLYHYYDYALFEKWNIPMRDMLLAMCQYSRFSIPMIEMITSGSNVPQLLEQAMSVGTFLTKVDDEFYSYRSHLQQYLKWKQSVTYTSDMIKENYNRGAHYYEMNDQIPLALEYYTKAQNEKCIVKLLIENAGKHPAMAYYLKTRKYYFALPETTVQKYPVLMCGMSLLYAMIMQPEQSDKWYDKLVEYEKNTSIGSQERKEAAVRIAYLDIALPQRGINGYIKKMMSGATLCINKKIKLPEFSVTGNAPSVMNGGLDFSEWSRNDKELAIILKKPLEAILGKNGVGLINIALAESGLEKGTMDSYEIMTRLNNGYHTSDVSGNIEMCFVATGLMIKEHLLQGQPIQAASIYDIYAQKAVSENANHLLPNLQTLHMWMGLLEGDVQEAKQWLETAPNDMLEFCILDRYQYIYKVRALLALDKKEEALALVERIHIYFTQYERHYYWIENQMLKSILLYRMGNDEWRTVLEQALLKGQHYHFVSVFALEGVALKPLLEKTDWISVKNLEEEYFNEIKTLNQRIATYYPNYMQVQNELEEPLTKSEDRILKLLCNGISSKEICEQCHITYNGYKFHVRNIYRKMKVKNRGEAERMAIRLGIDR